MSKLPNQFKFIDLSDYGRPIAKQIAISLKDTSVTPIQVTYMFIVSGLLGIACIILNFHFAAAFFIIFKSILDAADGELSRIKKMPSFVGRYFDSIADIILNFLFLLSFWYVTDGSIWLMLLAFVAVQLQGTLYNYYYVILRNKVSGDVTSRVFEDSPPTAMEGENQETVDFYFKVFYFLYGAFDKSIHFIDQGAVNSKPFPKWFMTLVSSMGLGFQLLIIGVMIVFNLEMYIIPFFICYTLLIVVLIAIRRFALS